MHKVLSLVLILIMSTSLLKAQDTINPQYQDTPNILTADSLYTLDSLSLINDIPYSSETNDYILIADSNNTKQNQTYSDETNDYNNSIDSTETTLPENNLNTINGYNYAIDSTENKLPNNSVNTVNDYTNSIDSTNSQLPNLNNTNNILIADSTNTQSPQTDTTTSSQPYNIVLEEDTAKHTPFLHPIAQARKESDSLSKQLQIYVTKLDSCNALYNAMTLERDSIQEQLDIVTKRYELTVHLRDSLVITNERYQKELLNTNSLLEDKVKAMTEKEKLLEEKEELYRNAMTNSTIDRTKFESEIKSKNTSIDAKAREIDYLQQDIDNKAQTLSAQKEDYERLAQERDRYIHLVDSLRAMVRTAELENVRKDEANKYLAMRAKEAEERVAKATSRKRKVRPIQGIAMQDIC